jgi:Recombinase
VEAHQAAARARAEDFRGEIEALRESGITSLTGIARELNRRGVKTPSGALWTATAAKRLLLRLAL